MAILLVEDDQAIRETLAELLRDDGYDVDVATNGAEALRFLKSNRYQLMLLDLLMPIMDGATLLRIVAQEGLSVPTVVISAAGGSWSAHKLPEPLPWLHKPFDVETLVRMIKEHVK